MAPALLAEDALIFGLRMNEGISVPSWRARVPGVPWAAIEALLERLANEGLAIWADGNVRLTDRGRLVADTIGVELMAAFTSDQE